MHTLVKASFADGIRLAALSALSFLGVLALSGAAAAQGNPFGPPPPAPGAPPGAPPATAPAPPPPAAAPSPFGPPAAAPGQFGPAPPGQFGPPAAAPPGAFGPPAAAPGQFGPSATTTDQGAPTTTTTDQPAAPATDAEQTPAEEEQERWLSLMEQTNLSGSTGLVHSSYAGSGAPGTFRVSFLTDWFTASNFLCRPTDMAFGPGASSRYGSGMDKSCKQSTTTMLGNGPSDTTSRVGGTFAINATPLSFLEAYAMLRTYATSTDQGNPQLLQVLGDTTLGVKAFLPPKLGRIFTFGGEIQLLLLNGTGGVGLAGGGTSALFRGLGTADFRKPNDGGLPLRFNLNLAYKVDNSGKLVEDVEEARGKALGYSNPPISASNPNGDPGVARSPITRIERFGLGINKVDSFQLFFAGELPFSRAQPFVEWSADLPVNRQGYYCHTGRVSNGDVCYGLENFNAPNAQTAGGPGFKAFPSRLTLGVKTNPLSGRVWHGLSAHASVDIGTSGVHSWIEEMAPQAPWTLYLGLGFVYDTKDPTPPPVPVAPPAPPPQIIAAPVTLVRGLVHEQGHNDVLVADAIVTFEGGVQSPLATGADGHFVTRNIEPGTYKLDIKAPGFKPGTCTAVVNPAGAAPAVAPPGASPVPGAPASPFGAPPASPFGAPPASPFGAPGGAPGTPGGPAVPPGNVFPPAGVPAAPTGPTIVDIDCPLESLPKTGNIYGVVRDGENGSPVAGAVVKLTDASNKEIAATADGSGNFIFKELTPGAVMLKGEASGYMPHISPAEVRASEDARPTLQINKRPKTPSVKVEGKEIKISKQIHFETDSAKILGDSNSLMEEIADVLQRNPNLRKVEIQGHTDNTGTREHNLQLSDARASSVKTWLVGAGIDGARLVPKGYGQDRPIAPNVTAANRTRNRRVQFIILEGSAK
jgi:outer membrane protein OmpA-like peptidoglycan-associated protein